MRRCTRCGEDKPLAAFSHRAYCRPCYNAYSRARYRRLSDAGYRRPSESAMRYGQIRWHADRRGIPFSLTRDQVAAFWGQPCHYCGGAFPGLGLDRVDNTRGYEPGNVVSCCGTCNAWKLDMGEAMFKEHLTRVYHHYVLGQHQLPLPAPASWQTRPGTGRPRLAD